MRVLIFTLFFATLTSSVFATQNKKQLKLRIQAPAGNIDEATVYFDQNIDPAYLYAEDAQKVFSGVAGVPLIYSESADNIPCSINGIGTLSSSETVSIGVDVDADGLFTVTAPNLTNFDPTSLIRLEDRANGRFTDMRTNFYQAQMLASEPATGRFFIHVSYPVTVTATVAGCLNNDGALNVSADNSVTWTTCQLFDVFNNSVGSYNNITGAYNFTGLAEGDYYMSYTFGAYSTTTPFHIDGNYIVANIQASAIVVATGEAVDFSAVANHSNQFEWDFGDGTLIYGIAHPTLAYYEPGVYQVNLKCSNSVGCIDNAQIEITVSQALAVNEVEKKEVSISASQKSILVNLNDANLNKAQLQVYNLIGQSVYNEPVDGQTSTVSFDEQPVGYYMVSVKNGEQTTTKRVFLGK